jgi:hypothetical protein
MLHSSFDPLGLTTSSDTLGKEVLSQVSMLITKIRVFCNTGCYKDHVVFLI